MKLKIILLLLLPIGLFGQNPINSVPKGALVVRINPTKWYSDAAKAEWSESSEKSVQRLLADISQKPGDYGINTSEPIWMVGNAGRKTKNFTILLSVNKEEEFQSEFQSYGDVNTEFQTKNGVSFLSDDELTVMLNNGIAILYFGKVQHFYESDYAYRRKREALLREIHLKDTTQVNYGEDNVQIIEKPVEVDVYYEDHEVAVDEATEAVEMEVAEEEQGYNSDEELSYSELVQRYHNHPRLVEFDAKWNRERDERKRQFMERQYREREDNLIEFMKTVDPSAPWRNHLSNSSHDVSVFFQVGGDVLSLGRIYRRLIRHSSDSEGSKLGQYLEETYSLTHVDFNQGEMSVQTIAEQSDVFSSDPILLNKKLKRSTRKMMPKNPYMYYTYHTDAEAMAELYMDIFKAMFRESGKRDSKMALAAIQTIYLLLDDDLLDDALEGGGFIALTGTHEIIRESKKYVYDTSNFDMGYKTTLDTTEIPEYVWVSHLGEDDFIPRLLEIGVDGGVLALDSSTGYYIQPDLRRSRMAPFQFYVGIINDHICVSNNANLLDAYRSGLPRKERISMSRSHLINQTGNTMYMNMDGISDAILTATSGKSKGSGHDETEEQIKELKELFGEITWKVEQQANQSKGTLKVETKEGTSSLVILFELLSRL